MNFYCQPNSSHLFSFRGESSPSTLWPPLKFFFFFNFIFDFLLFGYNMPRYSFSDIYALWCSELPGSVIWCLTLIWGKFSVIVASNTVSVPFSLLLLSNYSSYTLCSFPTDFGYSVPLKFFFSLLFGLEVSVDISSSLRGFFLSCGQSTNQSIKDILHFCYSVFFKKYLFIWLCQVLVVAGGIFSAA